MKSKETISTAGLGLNCSISLGSRIADLGADIFDAYEEGHALPAAEFDHDVYADSTDDVHTVNSYA